MNELKLDLTKEQDAQIKKINAFTRSHRKEIKLEMDALNQKINMAFELGDINEKKIADFVREKCHLTSLDWKYRLMERYNISKLLTPKQKIILHALIKQQREFSEKE